MPNQNEQPATQTRSMLDRALDEAQQIADQQADETTPAAFTGTTDLW